MARVARRAETRRRRLAEGRPTGRRRAGRIVLVAVAVLALLLLLLLSALWVLLGRFDRLPDVFGGDRPAAGKGVTFLLVGTDRRSLLQTTGTAAGEDAFVPGLQRADTVMLLHVTADRKTAYAVSIPRDTWVDIPGEGEHKINAAYSIGGPRLMVETVEKLTDVRIDHVAVVDWFGFRRLTDALGGVDVFVPTEVYDSARNRTWQQGFQHLNGEDALAYVGQRYGLPNGDFDRVARQQYFLRQLLSRTVSGGTLTDPGRVQALIHELVTNVSVDQDLGRLEMIKLAISVRSLDPQELEFFTVPTKGTGTAGDQSIVVYDPTRAARMWRAFKDDDVAKLRRSFQDVALGPSVS